MKPTVLLRLLLPLLAIALPGMRLIAQELPGEPFDERERETAERVLRERRALLDANGIDAASIVEEWNERAAARAAMRGGKGAGAGMLSATTWEFIGPRNQAGRIMGIAVGATDTTRWYCAADGGGVWRSTNSGDTWEPLTDSLPSLQMSCLAMSQANERLLLAGTHEGMIYRSTDAGDTWSAVALPGLPPTSNYIHDIQCDAVNRLSAWATAEGGLFHTTDAGATWKQVRTTGGAGPIALNPGNPTVILYGSADGSGEANIYRSTDGGSTWNATLTQQGVYGGLVGARLCAAHPQIVYAVIGQLRQYFRSSDGGATWTPLPAQPVRDSYYAGFDVFAVSPTDSNLVVAGGTSIFRTTNGGASWAATDTINEGVHVDQHGMCFPSGRPNVFIAGNDGGIFLTTDIRSAKLRWQDRNRDLVTLQIYNCAMHPQQPDTIIVGCQDNGYDKFSGDENNWLVVGGDGFCTIYDRDSAGYFYHEYVYNNLHRADNGFTWWSAKKMNGLNTDNSGAGFYSGITSPERADWFGQGIAMSPANPKTLYLGTNFLYRTTDRAESWTRVDDTEYGDAGYDYITAISASAAAPKRLFLGTQAGLMYRVLDGVQPRSTDITPVSDAPDRIRTIVVAADDSNLVYAGTDGGYRKRGVQRSIDGGATWTLKSKGLPRGGVNRLLIDPRNRRTLYCATTAGLYYTLDGGDNWLPMPGLPNVEVWDLAFHAGTNTLLLGTYGRGAIRARNFSPPGVSAVAVEPEAPDASLEVRATREGMLVYLALPVAGAVRVLLFDQLGRIVATLNDGELAAGEHEFAVTPAATRGLPAGTYFVDVRGGRMHLTRPCMLVR